VIRDRRGLSDIFSGEPPVRVGHGLALVKPTPYPTPVPTPKPTAEPTPEPTPEPRVPVFYGGQLELPVVGATGWAAAQLQLHTEPLSPSALGFTVMPAGQVFSIEDEYNEWWNVRLPNGNAGWVQSRGCFINLPDVIPSIVFNISNASYSLLRSLGYDIPGVSGYALYQAWGHNTRLGREEFLVPVQLMTAQRLKRVQQAALAQGDTIVMYEAFRPHQVQRHIVSNFSALINGNADIRAAVNTPPWSINWFISTGISHHQRGAAVDVSFARVDAYEIRFYGDYAYKHITGFVEYEMPTAMHELSPAAATLVRPGGRVADTMTDGALRMQELFLRYGFTLLASEWWHFNDPDAVQNAHSFGMRGEFLLQ